MLTSVRFAVSWVSNGQRYTLFHHIVRPCIAVANLFDTLECSVVTDIEVIEIDTGEPIEWKHD